MKLRKKCIRVTKFKSLRKNYPDPNLLLFFFLLPYLPLLAEIIYKLVKQSYCFFLFLRRDGPNFSLGDDIKNILLVISRDVGLGNLISIFKSNSCLVVWYISQSEV